jgi:hypothetical protein
VRIDLPGMRDIYNLPWSTAPVITTLKRAACMSADAELKYVRGGGVVFSPRGSFRCSGEVIGVPGVVEKR